MAEGADPFEVLVSGDVDNRPKLGLGILEILLIWLGEAAVQYIASVVASRGWDAAKPIIAQKLFLHFLRTPDSKLSHSSIQSLRPDAEMVSQLEDMNEYVEAVREEIINADSPLTVDVNAILEKLIDKAEESSEIEIEIKQ